MEQSFTHTTLSLYRVVIPEHIKPYCANKYLDDILNAWVTKYTNELLPSPTTKEYANIIADFKRGSQWPTLCYKYWQIIAMIYGNEKDNITQLSNNYNPCELDWIDLYKQMPHTTTVKLAELQQADHETFTKIIEQIDLTGLFKYINTVSEKTDDEISLNKILNLLYDGLKSHAKSQMVREQFMTLLSNSDAMQFIDKHWDWLFPKSITSSQLTFLCEAFLLHDNALQLIIKRWNSVKDVFNITHLHELIQANDHYHSALTRLITYNWTNFMAKNMITTEVVEWICCSGTDWQFIDDHWDWFMRLNNLYSSFYINYIWSNKCYIPLIEKRFEWFITNQSFTNSYKFRCLSLVGPFIISPQHDAFINKHWNTILGHILETKHTLTPRFKQSLKWYDKNDCPNKVILHEYYEDIVVHYTDNPLQYSDNDSDEDVEDALTVTDVDYIKDTKQLQNIFKNLLSEFIYSLLHNCDTFITLSTQWDHIKQLYSEGKIKKPVWEAIFKNEGALHFIDRRWDWFVTNDLVNCTMLLNNKNDYLLPFIHKHRNYLISRFTYNNWSQLFRHPHIIPFLNLHWDDIIINSISTSNILQTVLEQLTKNPFIHTLNIVHWNKIIFYAKSISNQPIINTLNFQSEYEIAAKKHFRDNIAPEIIACVFHPRNIANFPALGFPCDV